MRQAGCCDGDQANAPDSATWLSPTPAGTSQNAALGLRARCKALMDNSGNPEDAYLESVSQLKQCRDHTVAALTGSLALELSVSDFYRAFDASLDAGGGMKRSIASLLRAIGARSQQLPHRVLAEAIRSGDKERARLTARAIVVGPKRPG
jgi:hypothetical protein